MTQGLQRRYAKWVQFVTTSMAPGNTLIQGFLTSAAHASLTCDCQAQGKGGRSSVLPYLFTDMKPLAACSACDTQRLDDSYKHTQRKNEKEEAISLFVQSANEDCNLLF